MFDDFILKNFYYTSLILVSLSLLVSGWLYLDSFRNSKMYYDGYRGLGFIFLSLGYFIRFINTLELDVTQNLSLITILVGLCLISFGVYKEPNPEKPTLKIKNIFLNPFLFLIIPIINLILSIFITYQIHKKIQIGLSKQFKFLFLFWSIFSISLFFDLITFLGIHESFVTINVITQKYSTIWILTYFTIFISSILLFRWIFNFLSFRMVESTFISVWIFCIVITMSIVSIFSVISVNQSENQLKTFLSKNNKLVKLNLEQTAQNLVDIGNVIKSNQEITNALEQKNSNYFYNIFNKLIEENINISLISVFDVVGQLVYSTNFNSPKYIDPTDMSFKITSGNSFFVEFTEPQGDRLNVSNFIEIINNEEVKGYILLSKFIDDAYLDFLKDQTSQEFFLYVNGNRSASTVLLKDGKSRIEKIPLPKDIDILFEEDNTIFGKANIVTQQYYVSILNIIDSQNNSLAYLISGIEQNSLINEVNSTVFKTFLIGIFISLLSSFPSYLFARRMSKNLSV